MRLMGRIFNALAILCIIGCALTPAHPKSLRITVERNEDLELAITAARAMWAGVGYCPPQDVKIYIGQYQDYNGYCFCGPGREPPGGPIIFVDRPSPWLIAHELGHSMGLSHVEGINEIMAPSLSPLPRFGPGTMLEAAAHGSAHRCK